MSGSLRMAAIQAEADRLMRAASEAIGVGDWVGAESALVGCLALIPDDPSLSYNLALVEKRLGKTADAERRLRDLLKRAPDHANARFEYAAGLMDRGAEAEALREFETYLSTVPNDADALLNAGRLCLRLGRPEDAAVHTMAAEALRPGDPGIRLARAEALRDLGNMDEADRLLRTLYARAPSLRPAILKIMSQGPRGCVPISTDRLAAKSD